MGTTKDLYKLLEIPREASQEDIRKAHRRLVLKYHPDANPNDPTATERFKQVQQAYEVLSDENKRREYDKRFHTSSRRASSGRARAQGRAQGRGGASRRTEEDATTTSSVDLSSLLDTLKNAFENGRTGRSSTRNEDVSGGKPSEAGNEPREKKVKGPGARGREKRVKGPSARRRRKSD
jgi:curved DNA-binding protein CbpA